MASLASTMFATETSSAFLGTALPTGEAVASKSRVSMMAYNRQELERKPLALLRVLARQQGVYVSGKQPIIDALMKKGSYSYSPSYDYSTPSSAYSAPSSYSSASSGDAASYNALSLGELRALAKERGLRADTKAELVKLLLSTPAPATPSFSSSSSFGSAPASAPAGLPKAVLERKSLSELRALARVRGLRGDTKAELVKLLSSDSGASSSSSSSYSNGVASYSNKPSFVDNGAQSCYQYATPNSMAMGQLTTKSLSQLRVMAAIKAIRGSTKHELVQQLAALA